MTSPEQLLETTVTPDAFPVAHTLRNRNSFTRYDAMRLFNGVPVVQVEIKTLGINPYCAVEQFTKPNGNFDDGEAGSHAWDSGWVCTPRINNIELTYWI